MVKVLDLFRGSEGMQGEPQDRIVEYSRLTIIDTITGNDVKAKERKARERGIPLEEEWTVAPPNVVFDHFFPVPKGTYVLQRGFCRQGQIYVVVEPGNCQMKEYILHERGYVTCMGSHYIPDQTTLS